MLRKPYPHQPNYCANPSPAGIKRLRREPLGLLPSAHHQAREDPLPKPPKASPPPTSRPVSEASETLISIYSDSTMLLEYKSIRRTFVPPYPSYIIVLGESTAHFAEHLEPGTTNPNPQATKPQH